LSNLAFDVIKQPKATTIIDSSKIKDFIMCERYYFFRHVLGWEPDYPNNHLSFGSAWHEAMEHLLLTDYSQPNILRAYEKFLKRYREDFAPETDELYAPKTADNALIVLVEYCKRWQRDNFKTLFTEISGKVMLSETKHIYFKMDSICENSDNKIFSLEHKTGSSDYNWTDQWTLAVQPGVYSHVLYCLYPFEKVAGITMNAAFFKKVKRAWEQIKEGKKLTVQPPYDFLRYPIRKAAGQMNSWHANLCHHLDMLDWNLEQLATCRESDDVMNAFHCRSDNCFHYGRRCEFHDFCATWSNPIQKAYEPPIGFRQRYWDPTEEPSKTQMNIDANGGVLIENTSSNTAEKGELS